MNDYKFEKLLKEIENVDFKEFWYGSDLLEKAKKTKDNKIVKALTIRHHYLQNKRGGSCYVIRHTIKEMEGPYFNTLWNMILLDDKNEAEAASFILSEIGGIWSFQKILNLLRKKEEKIYHILVSCLIHLIARYYEIFDENEPTMQMMVVETRKTNTVMMKDFAPDIYQRTIRDRHLSNEYFKFTTARRIDEMNLILKTIPQYYFGEVDRNKFIDAIDNLKVK
jgi:hypothetical protein